MAALSPEKDLSGNKTSNSVAAFSRKKSLAETPPAIMMDLQGYFWVAEVSFSRRMSMAVFWKEAAKSATCCLVR